MAEIQESGGGKHDGGKVRSKKASTKVDMTPMVDLGFLLITFFMFTTTFSKPNNMKLSMPAKPDPTKPKPPAKEIKMSNTITVLMGKDDRLFWHQQAAKTITSDLLNETNYSKDGIRKAILEARKHAEDTAFFTVIVKPLDDANYKNTVDILDEMSLTKSSRYGLVDVSKEEQAAYNQKVGGSAPATTTPNKP